MLVFCYHNGAMGNSTMALIETCTKEGTAKFPSFFEKQNLHHYKRQGVLFQLKHPVCNVEQEQSLGNQVACSTATTNFGRYLILLMGLKKWVGDEPDLDHRVIYKQYGQTYGEQLEIVSVTINDKVKSDTDWFMDADHVLDIVNFWNNHLKVIEWIEKCGFTPNHMLVEKFCKKVAHTNQYYYDIISHCFNVVDSVIQSKVHPIELSFYETAMCHSLLLDHYKKSHIDIKLLDQSPTSTKNFIEIFNV
jgi:hypothetical protein